MKGVQPAFSRSGADRPYVSVVIAVRNGAATLQRCIDSVTCQTLDVWELIVVDGDSSDGSQRILQDNARSIGFWTSEPDRGIYQAWNKALAKARGEWIYFLGADDRFHDPHVLDEITGPLREAEGDYRVVYASIDKVGDLGQVLMSWGHPWASLREPFRKGMAIPHQAIFHHRSLFERHGGFDERYRLSGDYELLLRELVEHDAVFVPNLVIADMAAGGMADEPANRGLLLRESYRARRAHGLASRTEVLWLSFALLRARATEWLTKWFGPRVARSAARAYRCAVRRRGGKS
jgi:glycosyltransferase involved in cell wall biosynthesis